MPLDPMTFALLVVLLTSLLCATVVCVVALSRAHRTDVVAVVRALPELIAAFIRYRRKKQ
ncbi:hypothetical protein ACFWSP_35435 [Streptomyces sp. NPDC058618]|uniref:hypothetical protein n=1 Tax=Streptomyces sp. NPDC058618 TaxID=3346558 RepID=UPI0036555AA5